MAKRMVSRTRAKGSRDGSNGLRDPVVDLGNFPHLDRIDSFDSAK